MGLVSIAMLLWGAEKVFHKLPSSSLSNLFNSTTEFEAARIYQQLLAHHQQYTKATPTSQQLKLYENIALQKANIEQSKRKIADQAQLYLHPYVIKEFAKQSGILDDSNDNKKNNNTQLRTQIELVHQSARKFMIDEAVYTSAIADNNTAILSSKINMKRKFSWIEIPTVDKEHFQNYQPSAAEIQEIYDSTPFHEPEKAQIEYIIINTNNKTNLDSIYEQLLYSPNNLQAIADHYKVKIHTSKEFHQYQGNTTDLSKHKNIREQVFTSSLKLNKLSDPIQLDNNKVAIIKKTKHSIGNKKPLAEVKKTIVNTIKTQRAMEFQSRNIQSLHNKLTNDKTTLAGIAKQYKAKVKRSNWSSQDKTASLPKPIHSIGFSLSSYATGNANAQHVLSEDNNKWYIFTMDQSTENNDIKNDEQHKQSHQLLTEIELQKLYS